MKKYNEKQEEIINLMYEIEDMINFEKCWIEVSNAIMDNSVDYAVHIDLVLRQIEQQNIKIYKSYENLIAKIQKVL